MLVFILQAFQYFHKKIGLKKVHGSETL